MIRSFLLALLVAVAALGPLPHSHAFSSESADHSPHAELHHYNPDGVSADSHVHPNGTPDEQNPGHAHVSSHAHMEDTLLPGLSLVSPSVRFTGAIEIDNDARENLEGRIEKPPRSS